MQPITSFNWRRAMSPARWLAAFLGGAGLVGWAIWSIALATNGTAKVDVVQWVVWAAVAVTLVVAILTKGITELAAGMVLVAGAAALGVVSGFAAPALLAIPLLALAGLLFAASGARYTQTHEREATHLPA